MANSGLAIIDTHCHLWELELAKRGGLTPAFGPLFRTFSPVDLSHVALPCGISACILIESGKTRDESEAMEKIAASSDLIACFAPYVDLVSPTLEQELDVWISNPKFRAVRARFEGHPDPDILARTEVLRGIAKIAERGLILELLVRAIHLKYVLKIYEQIDHLKAVIEHMAKPDIEGGIDRREWESYMRALAANTSVRCKLSFSPRVERIGELLKEPGKVWPIELMKPFVGSLLEWFGPTRLMWGSDWPVTLLVASYEETLRGMRTALGGLEPSEEACVFRTTAVEFYKLGASTEFVNPNRRR
ncbi:MAG: amidohydrolase family protein [Candidatus Sulfotelmatobacter sp.]